MMRLFVIGTCAVCMLTLTSVAGAGMSTYQHIDDNDPETEAVGDGTAYWERDATDSLKGSANDGPPPNWKITCGAVRSCRYKAYPTVAEFADPDGWTSTVRMQFNEGAGGQVRNSVLTEGLNLGWGWYDNWGAGEDEVEATISGHGAEFSLGDIDISHNPTDGFHYYQIIYDPDTAGGTATWYLDGTSVYSSSTLNTHASRFYYFGDGNGSSGTGSSESQWALARLETGQHIHNPGEPLPGDANGDNVVNDQDASILAAHWQSGPDAEWGDGDFNDDGYVNDQDASILAAHWQETQEGATAVPEPSVLVLLFGAGLIGLLARARRRR